MVGVRTPRDLARHSRHAAAAFGRAAIHEPDIWPDLRARVYPQRIFAMPRTTEMQKLEPVKRPAARTNPMQTFANTVDGRQVHANTIQPGRGTSGQLRRQVHSDAAEQAQGLTAWSHTYRQLSPGAFRGEVQEMQWPSVLVYRESVNRAVLQSGTACPDTFLLGCIVAMEGEGVYNGACFDRPVLLASPPGGGFEFRTPLAHEVLAVGIPRLSAEALFASAGGPRSSTRLAPVPELGESPKLAGRLRGIFSLAQDACGHASPAAQASRAEHEIRERVLACLFDACGPGQAGHGRFPRIAASRYRIFRAADQYIREHAAEAIGIDTLCRVTHSSRRTLQYCFESIVGMGPLVYLRGVRLNGVRAELRRRDGAPRCVTDVAARWGFWHFSRFAAQYRHMFGESPSHTLRAAR